MGGRPGEHYGHPLRVGLLAVGPRLVCRIDDVEAAQAGDPDVGASRNGPDPVGGLAPAYRPQAWAEADEELGDLHPRPPGDQEVTQLVQDQHRNDRQDHHQSGQASDEAEGHQGADQEGQPDSTVAGFATDRTVLRIYRIDHSRSVPSNNEGPGHLAGQPVDVQYGLHVLGSIAGPLVQDVGQEAADANPRQDPVEEGSHGHLIGGVQPGRGRLAQPTGGDGQVQARETSPVGLLEVEAP